MKLALKALFISHRTIYSPNSYTIKKLVAGGEKADRRILEPGSVFLRNKGRAARMRALGLFCVFVARVRKKFEGARRGLWDCFVSLSRG